MLSLHRATSSDIPQLVQYRLEFLTEYWGEQKEEDINLLRENLTRIFTDYYRKDCYICYIARDGDKVAGIGGIILREQPGNFKNPSGKVGYILNMYTLEEYRRQGISTKILNQLIEDASARGFKAFELHATPDGEPVYIKNGFHKHPEPTYRMLLQ
jgi:GNAT superfamily N-acetyltransferase